MSIFKKIFNWGRKAKADAEVALTDVSRDAEFAIQDAKRVLLEKKKKVASHLSSIKKSQRELENAKHQVGKYRSLLAKATEHNNHKDIFDLQNMLNGAKKSAVRKHQILTESENLYMVLMDNIAAIEASITEADAEKDNLIARDTLADIKKEMSGSDPDDSPLDELEALKEHVDKKTYQAEADTEVFTSNEDKLTTKYSTPEDYSASYNQTFGGDCSGSCD